MSKKLPQNEPGPVAAAACFHSRQMARIANIPLRDGVLGIGTSVQRRATNHGAGNHRHDEADNSQHSPIRQKQSK
jgi:hypothetical protein